MLTPGTVGEMDFVNHTDISHTKLNGASCFEFISLGYRDQYEIHITVNYLAVHGPTLVFPNY